MRLPKTLLAGYEVLDSEEVTFKADSVAKVVVETSHF